jgi:hypothetical protein
MFTHVCLFAIMCTCSQRIATLGKYDAEVASRPALREYARRLRARPAWKATFAEADSTFGKVGWALPAVYRVAILSPLGLY